MKLEEKEEFAKKVDVDLQEVLRLEKKIKKQIPRAEPKTIFATALYLVNLKNKRLSQEKIGYMVGVSPVTIRNKVSKLVGIKYLKLIGKRVRRDWYRYIYEKYRHMPNYMNMKIVIGKYVLSKREILKHIRKRDEIAKYLVKIEKKWEGYL